MSFIRNQILRPLYHVCRHLWHTRYLKSLYVNFRVLPFRQAIRMPIVIIAPVKIRNLSGRCIIKKQIHYKMFCIGTDVDNMPQSFLPAQLNIQGTLVLNGFVSLNKGASLVVWPDATMTLGDDVMICSGVTIKAVNNVTVGNHVMISAGCFIMDSSIHCIYNTNTMETDCPDGEITIGNNVWLNMYTDVIKWGSVPDGCITTRYSLINKIQDPDDINCILAGQPAKVIKRGYSQVHNFTTERFIRHHADNAGKLILNNTQVRNENLVKKVLP